MELVFHWLRVAGYPEQAIVWVRKRRARVFVGLAIVSWLPIIGLGCLVWYLLA